MNLKMVQSTLANGNINKDMGGETKFGKMAPIMKDIGKITTLMVKED